MLSYLIAGSFEVFKTLQLDMGYDIQFHAAGGLQAVQTPQQRDYDRDRVLQQKAEGYKVELMTTREARAIEPEASECLAGFVFFADRGRANPTKATVAFGEAAGLLGADIKTGHEVQGLSQQQDGSWQAQTGHGEFRAESLVLAAGAWSGPLGDLLGIKIPVAPVRGKTRNGEIIFGGDRQMVGYDYNPDANGIEVNRGHASEVIPLVSRLPISRTWAGIMPFSMDGMPIIGRIPHSENQFVLTGLASSGFVRGPMAGELLADYIHTGHPAPVLSDSDRARCITWI